MSPQLLLGSAVGFSIYVAVRRANVERWNAQARDESLPLRERLNASEKLAIMLGALPKHGSHVK